MKMRDEVHCIFGLSTAKQITFGDVLFIHAFTNSNIASI